MEKQYYIALSLLGIKNNILINIMELLPEKKLKKLFEGNVLELEYQYNLGLSKYMDVFEDKEFLKRQLENSEIVLNKNKEYKIRTILYKDKSYPKNLKEIDNAPAILYLKGKNILKEDLKSIACVGTRNPTKIGIEATKSLVTNLVKEKFTIVSGLALGIDAISHQTCLDNNGRTIAVLAHGLDIVYPNSHKKLAEAILRRNGTIISEYPVGTQPDKFRFVDRNRIVSGIASGVVMVEAKEKSGTKHTVDFSIKQKKPVFFPTYNTQTLENGLNFKLLSETEAIPINIKNDYVLILKKLGYKLKYDEKLIGKLKNQALDRLIMPLRNGSQKINIDSSVKNDSKTGFDVNKEVYTKFKKILKDNDITLKEFFNAVINNIVKDYSEGE